MLSPAVRQVLGILLTAAALGACNFPRNDQLTPGSKGLWVANGTNVVEYNPGQLAGGAANIAPHVSINSAVFGSPQGVAFDPTGNLWVLDKAGMVGGTPTPALFEFSAAQLAALATDNAPEPIATITSGFLIDPREAYIDTLGNLWLTDYGSNAVMTWTQSQLAQTGANLLQPVLLMTGAAFNGPSGLAFDSNGNLWLVNTGGLTASDGTTGPAGTTIIEIDAANIPALPESGTSQRQPLVDVTLTDNGAGSVQGPWGLGFDSQGNLWSANSATPGTFVLFAKATLVTGAPTPAVTISSTTVDGVPTLNGPNGLCVDDADNVAVVSSAAPYGIAFYGSKQLTSGAPVPQGLLAGSATGLNAPTGCTFGPQVR